MIAKCKCNHAGQDKLHGEGRRVFNKTEIKVSDKDVYRCSCCGEKVSK